MSPNHGGDPLGSFLGRMGSHWVQKMGSNSKKLPCPKIRIFGGHRFFAKNGSYGYCAKSRWGPPRVNLGANGVPLGPKKWVKTVKNYHASKFEFLAIDFSQKIEVMVMTPNHGGDPLGFILGPMGSHWFQKLGQNRKKLPCRNKSKLRLWRQITVGTPSGPSWGQWDPIGSKKWVKTVKNYHAPKFEFLASPRSSIFRKKSKLRLRHQITVGTP